jgi:hypothetical protein
VRHGNLPEREIMTSIGPIAVRSPRVSAPSSRSPMARSGSGKQSKRYGRRPAGWWVHKTKRPLQEIWMAEITKDALAAFDAFVNWGVKYDKSVECLIKDRDALLAFYDFPTEHWKHLRTTNVIEIGAPPHVRSKGRLSNKTALAMIFKLAEPAEKSWRRLNGHNQLPKIILGIKFTDGIKAQVAAA